MNIIKIYIDLSLLKTDVYNSKLTNDIYFLHGMSGFKTRCFYNNICSMRDARYLEIGSWKGSTICSAMFENPHGYFMAIDNFSEFNENENVQDVFYSNTQKYKYGVLDIIENDCFSVDISQIKKKYNIFMYDGYHDYNSHYSILNYYMDVLDDTFIYIVDDYNWDFIQNATRDSIKDTCIIHYEFTKLTEGNDKNDFWNGMYVGILLSKK